MSERTRPAITARARSKKKQSVPIEYRALPTPERMRRAGNDYVRGDIGQITLGDNPLDRSFSRGVISQEQYAAAQKFRHHWYHAGLADRLRSLDLDRVFAVDLTGFSGMAKSEGQAFHRQRYREAVQVVGKIGSHVLDSALCREIGFEQIGYSLGWGSRAQAYAAAVERTKAALDQLWQLWGIA